MDDNRTLWWARLGTAAQFFFLGCSGASWLARLPAIRDRLALDDQQLGMFLLCSGIGALVAFRSTRLFLHLVDSRQLATVCTCVCGVLLSVPAATHSALVASLSLGLFGYACGLIDISINANAVVLERRMGRPILASLHGFCSLGGFFGAAVGALAAWFDIPPTTHLLAVGATIVVASVASGRVMLADPPSGEGRAPRLRYTRPLVILGTIAFCSSVGEGAMAQWTAIYLHDSLKTGMGLAAFGYAAYSGAMVTGRLLGDHFTDRWAARTILGRCGTLTALSLVATLATPNPYLAIAGSMGVGVGLSLVIPVVFRSSTALSCMPPAAALSAVATLSYGGFLFGPPAIGFVAQAVSLRLALGLVAVLATALAGLSRLVPRLQPSQQVGHSAAA